MQKNTYGGNGGGNGGFHHRLLIPYFKICIKSEGWKRSYWCNWINAVFPRTPGDSYCYWPLLPSIMFSIDQYTKFDWWVGFSSSWEHRNLICSHCVSLCGTAWPPSSLKPFPEKIYKCNERWKKTMVVPSFCKSVTICGALRTGTIWNRLNFTQLYEVAIWTLLGHVKMCKSICNQLLNENVNIWRVRGKERDCLVQMAMWTI